jgi:hypothetical protein
MALDSKIPEGSISDKWTNYKDHINLVNPANKRNLDVIEFTAYCEALDLEPSKWLKKLTDKF